MKNKTILIAAILIVAVSAACARAGVTLKSAEGEVLSGKGDPETWKQVAPGAELENGAGVKTAAKSTAVLAWPDGHSVKLSPLSIIRLEKYDRDKGTQLDMPRGRCVARVKKLTGQDQVFTIKSPSAISGVRGTAFEFAVAEDGATTVAAIEDSVFVLAQDVEVILEEGFMSMVEQGMVPEDPQPIPEERLDELKEEAEAMDPDEQTDAEPDDTQEATDEAREAAEEHSQEAVEDMQEVMDQLIIENIENLENIEDHMY